MARRGLGTTWPNPSVGCVIVSDGRVVGRGVTAAGGRPHAEPVALAMAGEHARGATAYVTLEPCCHWGRSPPCTDALIEAGIARVVVGTRDPDPRVNGQGIAKLRAAGVAVDEGVLEDRMPGNAGRLHSAGHHRAPDGDLETGHHARRPNRHQHRRQSQWITGTPARRLAHALRGRNDAVMVGVGTVLADNPELTCRIPGFRSTPVVQDRRRQSPAHAADLAPGSDRRRNPDLVPDSRRHRPDPPRCVRQTGRDPDQRSGCGGRGRSGDRPAGAWPCRPDPTAGRGRRPDRGRPAARRPGRPNCMVPRPHYHGRRWLARGAGVWRRRA